MPVVEFGILVDRPNAVPIAVNNSTGSFAIEVRPGDRSLYIVGRGFARKALATFSVPVGGVDLGDIEVHPGFRVDGVVRDQDGNTSAGVLVRLQQSDTAGSTSRPLAGDWMAELARGNFEVETDKRGRFAIQGVASVDLSTHRWKVTASVPGRAMSLPLFVNVGNHTIDLTILPLGRLEGGVERLEEGLVFARPTWQPDLIVPASVVEGRYEMELPVGQYTLFVRPISPRARRYDAQYLDVSVDSSSIVDFTLAP